MKFDFIAKIMAEIRTKTCIDKIDVEVLEVLDEILQENLVEYYNEAYTYGHTIGYDKGYDDGYDDGKNADF